MKDQQAISRVAKILARATSPEPNEANSALQAAYKRMRRDGVGVRDLLTLPLTDLYQEPLVKLVMVILEEQKSLSPPERRKAFEVYMAMITERFSDGESGETQRNSKEEAAERREWQAAEARRQKREQEGRDEARRQWQAREEEERRRAQQKEELRREKVRPEEAGSKTAEVRPQPPPRDDESSVQLFGLVGVLVLIVGAVVVANTPKEMSMETSPSPAPQLEVASPPPRQVVPTHALAAPQAIMRLGATPDSPQVGTVGRGESLTMIAETEHYVKVKNASGLTGYLSRDVLIPFNDLARLTNWTGQQYVESRKPEMRVEALLSQAGKQTNSFVLALSALSERSRYAAKYLADLQAARSYSIEPDTSAAIWYSLAAREAVMSSQYEAAYWHARAAIEAEPTNVEHHVFFAYTNYETGNYEAFKRVGRVLPRLGPGNTDAWLIFALVESLDEQANPELTKAAFILAIRLSRNAETTRKFLRGLAETTKNAPTRILLYSALAEERESPDLFLGVDTLNSASQASEVTATKLGSPMPSSSTGRP